MSWAQIGACYILAGVPTALYFAALAAYDRIAAKARGT